MRTHLLILYLILPAFAVIAQKQKNSEFTLVKQEGDISLYERWIPFPKSDPPVEAREVKGEFTCKASIYQALRLLQNEKLVKQWQNSLIDFKLYRDKDTTTWLEYGNHRIPGPLHNQDYLLKYKMTTKPGLLYLVFESIKNDKVAPLRDGVTRMELSGSWTFQQINPKKTKVVYRILSKPSNVPKFLSDPIVRSNLMSNFQQFVAVVEK